MRLVTIATTSFLVEDHPHTIDMNVERAREYIREAAGKGADILCLPEMVTTANVPEDLEYHAEDYPGEYTEAFQAEAGMSGINLIAPYLVRSGGNVYNQATSSPCSSSTSERSR